MNAILVVAGVAIGTVIGVLVVFLLIPWLIDDAFRDIGGRKK